MSPSITFRNPPVAETVLTAQFDRIRALSNAHLGAFWQSDRPDWKAVKDAPPLEESFETFGRERVWRKELRFQVTDSPAARIQIRNEDGDRMLQIQNCRLDYNWIGQEGADYPRYASVKPEFEGAMASFRRFLQTHRMGEPTPNQWEVTYVNHIPRGELWDSPSDWVQIFPSLLSHSAVMPERLQLESIGGHWHFEIAPKKGRLHLELQHALHGPKRREILLAKLTARGPVTAAEGKDPIEAVSEGLDLGHDTIVQTFADLTSKEAHDHWNRESTYVT